MHIPKFGKLSSHVRGVLLLRLVRRVQARKCAPLNRRMTHTIVVRRMMIFFDDLLEIGQAGAAEGSRADGRCETLARSTRSLETRGGLSVVCSHIGPDNVIAAAPWGTACV